jgi:hypothetical protein
MVSTTEHQESDQQTRISINLVLPAGQKIQFFPRTCNLAMNTVNYACGLHNHQRQLDTGFKDFLGTSLTMFNLSRRKKSKSLSKILYTSLFSTV